MEEKEEEAMAMVVVVVVVMVIVMEMVTVVGEGMPNSIGRLLLIRCCVGLGWARKGTQGAL